MSKHYRDEGPTVAEVRAHTANHEFRSEDGEEECLFMVMRVGGGSLPSVVRVGLAERASMVTGVWEVLTYVMAHDEDDETTPSTWAEWSPMDWYEWWRPVDCEGAPVPWPEVGDE